MAVWDIWVNRFSNAYQKFFIGVLPKTEPINPQAFDCTFKANDNDKSNCQYCAIAHNNNSKRIYKIKEMEADHVTAWTKGGSTDISNCEMLCKSHNAAKGNR